MKGPGVLEIRDSPGPDFRMKGLGALKLLAAVVLIFGGRAQGGPEISVSRGQLNI